MSEICGYLLTCAECDHAIGVHDGSGCHIRHCRCALTMDTIVQQNISLEVKAFQSSFVP